MNVLSIVESLQESLEHPTVYRVRLTDKRISDVYEADAHDRYFTDIDEARTGVMRMWRYMKDRDKANRAFTITRFVYDPAEDLEQLDPARAWYRSGLACAQTGEDMPTGLEPLPEDFETYLDVRDIVERTITNLEREEAAHGYCLHPIAGEISAREYVRRLTIDHGAGSLYEDVCDGMSSHEDAEQLYALTDRAVTDLGYEVG